MTAIVVHVAGLHGGPMLLCGVAIMVEPRPIMPEGLDLVGWPGGANAAIHEHPVRSGVTWYVVETFEEIANMLDARRAR